MKKSELIKEIQEQGFSFIEVWFNFEIWRKSIYSNDNERLDKEYRIPLDENKDAYYYSKNAEEPTKIIKLEAEDV